MSELRSSPILKWALIVFAALLVALLIFHAGVAFGERHVLDRMRPHNTPVSAGVSGPMGMLPHSFLPDGHGVVGSIQSISLPTLTVAERDGEQESITLNASTTVERGSQAVAPSSLAVGQQILIVGMPGSTEGSMQAQLIKVFP